MAEEPNEPNRENRNQLASDNLYVVTENGEQCFMWRSNQLTYIAQDREEIPAVLANKFGQLATKLDLSYNGLTSFKFINNFINLNELVLDNNHLDDNQLDFKQNLRLKTLSLNKNKLSNLFQLIQSIKINFPNLEYLSLIGNPLCPGSGSYNLCNEKSINAQDIDQLDATKLLLNGSTDPIGELPLAHRSAFAAGESSNQKYRQFIIYHLPNLRFLDSSPINSRERDEALRRCFWMKSTPSPAATNLNQVNSPPLLAATIHTRRWCQDESLRPANQPDNNLGEPSFEDAAILTDTQGHHQQFQLTIMGPQGANQHTDERASSVGHRTSLAQGPKGVFSRLVYKYTGRNSEGNRFIRNQDL